MVFTISQPEGIGTSNFFCLPCNKGVIMGNYGERHKHFEDPILSFRDIRKTKSFETIAGFLNAL